MISKNLYTYPVNVTNKVRVSYKDSPAHTGRLQHAVDFICREGTTIKAAFDGLVVEVKQDSNLGGQTEDFDMMGNYIEIKHPNGEYSIYEHIMQNGSTVKVGDNVKVGQNIGCSGKTGWIAHLGPHLHFDVHVYVGRGSEDYESIKINWVK